MMTSRQAERSYQIAREQYAELGVDTEEALKVLESISLSLPCWQGDDVRGFEPFGGVLDGGLAATGNYLGRARTGDELRADAEKAFSLIPGRHRFNLHAIYAETDRRIERNELQPEHFSGWIEWAKGRGIGLDFNPTFFSHPKAADGLTLTHPDVGIRTYWIEHGIACRKIGAAMGRALSTPAVTNIWIPDGSKDSPFDRKRPRERLVASLDAILTERFDRRYLLDSVEGKLFGIGTESYTAGSHEFYLAYAVRKGILLCLDTGHYHPTETVADKISAILCFVERLLLHMSRGVWWDSDHVVILSDEVRAIAQELVRGDYLQRVHIGLDFFDASINRVAAWVIGARAVLQALLEALLEPADLFRNYEDGADFTARLALAERTKMLPAGAVWDCYCLRHAVPVGMEWLKEVKDYENTVLSKRK
ncbi:MAG: L-rhamnose isomerase [Kiritimatiellia bacterium]